MAAGIRVDDLSKLGKDFRWENDVFVIPYLEKRKCKVRKVWTQVQRLAPYTGSPRLCPVNALLLYSTFAVRVQNPLESALFVSSTGQKASVATLKRWITNILLEAGISANCYLHAAQWSA